MLWLLRRLVNVKWVDESRNVGLGPLSVRACRNKGVCSADMVGVAVGTKGEEGRFEGTRMCIDFCESGIREADSLYKKYSSVF